jgi:uncharacterized surface protein with fasciclin (FAS1) repeats
MMHRRSFVGLTLAAGAGALVSACAPEAPAGPTIREIFDTNASFSTLAQSLAQANVQSLDDAGPFTVFAPRNSAFAKVPEDELERLMRPENRGELARILQLHVVQGSYPAAALVNRTTTLVTLSGLSIIVDGFDGLNVGGVNVVQPDVMASNGVIHVVDGLILPPS